MRRQFSPAGVCCEDGSMNQDFFKPKRVIIQLTEDKKWGPPERDALYKVGGVGGGRRTAGVRHGPSSGGGAPWP